MAGNIGEKVSGVRYVKGQMDSKARMACFDALPVELRKRISVSVASISPQSVENCLKAGFSVRQVMNKIDDFERAFIRSAYADRGVSE